MIKIFDKKGEEIAFMGTRSVGSHVENCDIVKDYQMCVRIGEYCTEMRINRVFTSPTPTLFYTRLFDCIKEPGNYTARFVTESDEVILFKKYDNPLRDKELIVKDTLTGDELVNVKFATMEIVEKEKKGDDNNEVTTGSN